MEDIANAGIYPLTKLVEIKVQTIHLQLVVHVDVLGIEEFHEASHGKHPDIRLLPVVIFLPTLPLRRGIDGECFGLCELEEGLIGFEVEVVGVEEILVADVAHSGGVEVGLSLEVVRVDGVEVLESAGALVNEGDDVEVVHLREGVRFGEEQAQPPSVDADVGDPLAIQPFHCD